MLALLAAALLHQAGPVRIEEALVIEGSARGGRAPFSIDSVQKMIVEGTWVAPKEGDAVGSAHWHALKANKDGAIEPANAGGSYAYATVDSPDAHVALLKASGHSMVYVNGEPRTGDPYGYGYVILPVLLHKGRNSFLFALGRGGVKAALEVPKSSHVLNVADPTTPDLRQGEKGRFFAAFIVVNGMNSTAKKLTIRSRLGSGEPVETVLPDVPALSVRKVKVDFQANGSEAPGDLPLKLTLGSEDEATVNIRVRKIEQTYKRTFVSHIDGSVQYYAVNPAPIQRPGQALVLSLHGASVEATSQADAYSSKDWCNIVCPTNRRPYGFDWEGIGREDAMEVLQEASKELQPDPRRIYLCGHSMGGHGAWTVGAHYPDRFAVVFPSAGWQSFYTYAGQKPHARKDDPMGQIFERAAADSDTSLLVDNLKSPALYGLHGTADDNVPIAELRNMRDLLKEHGIEFAGYHEQPGAGHWWDVDPAPGADCVDWKPAFQLMKDRLRTLAADLKPVDFTTVNPGASATCEWVTILQQTHPGEPSRVRAHADVPSREIFLATSNVSKFNLELPAGNWIVRADEGLAKAQAGSSFVREESGWVQKKDHTTSAGFHEGNRTGPFGQVFSNQVAFVYATHGTPEENAWSYAKARFDAETLLVRGNGSVDMFPDNEMPRNSGRNFILYGNMRINSGHRHILGDGAFAPAQASVPGTSSLVLAPGRNGKTVIGVVEGSDLVGDRLLDRLGYFTSGVAYPDWTIFSGDVLDHGIRGVVGAGFFDANWGYNADNTVWASRKR